jgi:hypothetical protein
VWLIPEKPPPPMTTSTNGASMLEVQIFFILAVFDKVLEVSGDGYNLALANVFFVFIFMDFRPRHPGLDSETAWPQRYPARSRATSLQLRCSRGCCIGKTYEGIIKSNCFHRSTVILPLPMLRLMFRARLDSTDMDRSVLVGLPTPNGRRTMA